MNDKRKKYIGKHRDQNHSIYKYSLNQAMLVRYYDVNTL